jgi:anti-sigma factor ChrR (cupin superfamily)
MTTAASPLSTIILVGDLQREERQPGVRAKSLWADAATKRRAVMARIEPGAQLPLHRHVGDELNYRPNACVHAVTTKNGATVLAVVWGHTEPV